MGKPILCLDFDGVLHSYTSKWRGPDHVADPPTAGAQAALSLYQEHFDVQIFSSRSHQNGGIEAMMVWMHANNFKGDYGFPQVKPPALVTLDDRAITFVGTWPSVEALRAFRPWNKK